MEEQRRCPYCDELIRYNAVKCKHCGSVLTNSATISTGIITPETQIRSALSSRYEILEEIGRGGMASVYKAIQKNLSRQVALKVIHQNLIYDNEFLERFHQEAQLCASLNHPNIVTIYDEGAESNIHYMAMEYLAGNDLQRIIKYNGNIIIDDVIKIIISMANALDYAHSKGLIHRDIKSANIIITSEGRSVLTDFGIAFAANSSKLTQAGSVIGTPEYMSPEQAKGLVTDNRSDVYSLCVVMYECLVGKVPFSSENPLTTIFKIINEKPPYVKELNKAIPQWLSIIISKGLEKDPQRRFQSGKELSLSLINKKSVVVEPFNKVAVKNKGKTSNPSVGKHLKNKSIWGSKLFYFIIVVAGIIAFVISTPFFSFFYERMKPPMLMNEDIETGKDNITILLNTAENLFNAGNFVSPSDNNAYLFYSDVLNVDSGNERAIEGLNNIQKYFVDNANYEYENSNYKNSIVISDSGLQFFQDNLELLRIKSDAEVQLNKPEPIPRTSVPAVVGLQLSSAQDILRLNNLKVGTISKVISLDRKGLVINQIPNAGTTVNRGSFVNLIIGE
jgi:serine/threonine protein kinase